MRRLRNLVAAAAALAAVAVALPASADASLKAIWGPTTLPDGSSAFPVYQKLGVDVLQIQLHWDAVAFARPANPRDPADPAYHWPADLDQAISAAEAVGMRVLLMPMRTPAWANGGFGPALAPTNPADFADFTAAAAARYPAVKHWMIWGEPTINLLPMDPQSREGPQIYARILDAAYEAIKGVHSSNIVIGGNTWTNASIPPKRWLKWSRLPNGKPPRLDWFGHNPFSFRFPDIHKRLYYPGVRDISDMDTLHREVVQTYRSRHRRPRLWLSEFTVLSGKNGRAFRFHVTRRQQARWLAAAYRLAHHEKYIAGLGWWKLLDDPPRPGAANAGLMTWGLQHKPSFRAYRRAR